MHDRRLKTHFINYNIVLLCFHVLCHGMYAFQMVFSMAIHAFTFQRKGCSYGKLFSLVESTAQLWPTASDYQPLDVANTGLYEFVQV